MAVGALHVESCVITGFEGTGDVGNGISFHSPGELFVTDSTVRDNGWVAIFVIPATGTASASIDHCRMEAQVFGVVCDPNGVATVRDSLMSEHANYGAYAEGVASEINIEKCMITNNGGGVASRAAGIVRVSNTTVTDNFQGLHLSTGGSLLSRGNNTVEGNTPFGDGSFTGTYSAK